MSKTDVPKLRVVPPPEPPPPKANKIRKGKGKLLLDGKDYIPSRNHSGAEGLADFAKRMERYAKDIEKQAQKDFNKDFKKVLDEGPKEK